MSIQRIIFPTDFPWKLFGFRQLFFASNSMFHKLHISHSAIITLNKLIENFPHKICESPLPITYIQLKTRQHKAAKDFWSETTLNRSPNNAFSLGFRFDSEFCNFSTASVTHVRVRSGFYKMNYDHHQHTSVAFVCRVIHLCGFRNSFVTIHSRIIFLNFFFSKFSH